MSNQITIQPTQFTDIRTGKVTYGVRVYDDESQNYDNTWKTIPNDDLEVLDKCSQNASFEAFFNYIWENEKGVYIGQTYYPWEQIKQMLSK